MLKHPKVGDVVVFHDSKGTPINALVTCYFGNPEFEQMGCANLVWVSTDENRQDSCGRQTEKNTSIVHKSYNPAHGNYWRWPEEEPNPYMAPSSV